MTEIVVLSTCRNADRYAAACIQSVNAQSYPAETHVFIDDASTDRTHAEATLAAGERTMVIRRDEPCRGLRNIAEFASAMPPHSVIAVLDGDDELVPGALERVANEYEDPDCWMTYGQFECSTGLPGFAEAYPDGCDYRRAPWRATHLKTFRAALFQQVPKSHLVTAHGQYIEHAWDLALMFPMLELAGTHHRFIPDVLYRYNVGHSFAVNANLCDREYEALCERFIRNKKPLTPLASLTF